LPVVAAATAVVVTLNVAVRAPSAMVTLAGTLAAAFAVDSVTTAPPEGAFPVNVNVAVDEAGPTTVAGLKVVVESVAGVTVRFAVRVTPA
jgi:hypothetical protein